MALKKPEPPLKAPQLGFANLSFVAAILLTLLATDPLHVSPIAGTAFDPENLPPYPALTDPTIKDPISRLRNAERRFGGDLFGPESLTFDASEGGGPYASISDGRVVLWHGPEVGWKTFATTAANRTGCDVAVLGPNLHGEERCGRPLGLRFHPTSGDLYICDAYFGLMRVGPAGGQAEVLSNEAEGVPFRLTNDVDIDETTGLVYFTDASSKYPRRQFLLDIMEGRAHGRLLVWDPTTGATTVLLRGLRFANGLQLSVDRSFLLISETVECRILRYWIKGPKAGSLETFLDLPGYPDNIRSNARGEIWIPLAARRNRVTDLLGQRPFLRRAILSLPVPAFVIHAALMGGPHAMAMKVDEQGQVLEVLEDRWGQTVRVLSEVYEHDNQLWFGSVMSPGIAVYNLTSS